MNDSGSRIAVATMQPGDWEQVRAIYLEGIATGNATFETEAPSWEKWDGAHVPAPRLVARHGRDATSAVIGWAALSAVSSRCVYAGVADESVYVAAAARGQGVGRILLATLCQAAEAAGIWTIQAGIFPENVGSLRLHEACGFRVIGRREKLGRHHGVWRDVLMLERRSSLAEFS
jgi:L-amino acid N-acyltransferase YncA